MTIIMVTNRMQGIKYDYRIYNLEEGQIQTSGTPEELLNGESLFLKAPKKM